MEPSAQVSACSGALGEDLRHPTATACHSQRSWFMLFMPFARRRAVDVGRGTNGSGPPLRLVVVSWLSLFGVHQARCPAVARLRPPPAADPASPHLAALLTKTTMLRSFCCVRRGLPVGARAVPYGLFIRDLPPPFKTTCSNIQPLSSSVAKRSRTKRHQTTRHQTKRHQTKRHRCRPCGRQ